jgi:hypothetical protein
VGQAEHLRIITMMMRRMRMILHQVVLQMMVLQMECPSISHQGHQPVV